MVILDAADRALCLEYPDTYVWAWVGLIDFVTNTITYASAGHPSPLLISASGTVRELSNVSTMLMGLRHGLQNGQSSVVTIAQGDVLVLYTDGITEAERDIIAGNLALRDAAVTIATAGTAHPTESIERRIFPHACADDAALLIVRTDSREAERFIESWTFDVRRSRRGRRGQRAAASRRRIGIAWFRAGRMTVSERPDGGSHARALLLRRAA